MLPVQGKDKQIIFPFRYSIALVKTNTPRRYDRVPIVNRLLHACLLLNAFSHFCTAIVYTICNYRPAVVFAGMNNIDFIATTGTKFCFPQFARGGVDFESIRIAMPERIDLWLSPGFIEKRI